MTLLTQQYLSGKYPNVHLSGPLTPGGFCYVDSRVHGLFACFYCILYGLYVCDQEHVTPLIKMGPNHFYYDPLKGNNIFRYFYQQVEPDREDIPTMTITNPAIFLRFCNISNREKLYSNVIIEKYFVLLDTIREEIASFEAENFRQENILGVHYRGRDKIQETLLVSFSDYLKRMENMFDRGMCDKVFLATDELDLRDYVRNRLGDRVILYDIECDYGYAAGNTSEGLHLSTQKSAYLHAKDALMECYLLSKCQLLMSSSRSSMSLFATFLNPAIPHIIMEP